MLEVALGVIIAYLLISYSYAFLLILIFAVSIYIILKIIFVLWSDISAYLEPKIKCDVKNNFSFISTDKSLTYTSYRTEEEWSRISAETKIKYNLE